MRKAYLKLALIGVLLAPMILAAPPGAVVVEAPNSSPNSAYGTIRTFSYQPAWVFEEVTGDLTARVTTEPTGYAAPTGPTWTWSLDASDVLQYSTDLVNWGSVPDPNAVLVYKVSERVRPAPPTVTQAIADALAKETIGEVTFQSTLGGYYKLKPVVTATYSDGSSDSKRPEVILTIVDVYFDPALVVVGEGEVVDLAVTVTPTAQASALSFNLVPADGSSFTPVTIVSTQSTATGLILKLTTDETRDLIYPYTPIDPPLTNVLAQLGGRPIPQPAQAPPRMAQAQPLEVWLENPNTKQGKTPLDSDNVAIRTDLNGLVTPANQVQAVTFTWNVAGNPLKNYKHKFDDAAVFAAPAFGANVVGVKVFFFWVAPGKFNVELKADVTDNANKVHNLKKTRVFDVTRLSKQESQQIYCADSEPGINAAEWVRRCPNGDPGGWYMIARNHERWHLGNQMQLDTGVANPTGSQAGAGNRVVWGDRSNTATGLNNAPAQWTFPEYAGNAFIDWHRNILNAFDKWHGQFTVPVPAGQANAPLLGVPPHLDVNGAAPAMPTRWSAGPGNGQPHAGEVRTTCPTFGYVRLGEYANTNELGQSMNGARRFRVGSNPPVAGTGGWHGEGHASISSFQGTPYTQMSALVSPHAPDEVFWAWHEIVDTAKKAYAGRTKALIKRDAANAAKKLITYDKPTNTITIGFQQKVSSTAQTGAGETNASHSDRLSAGRLTVNGKAATGITTSAGANRFVEFHFRGFPRGAQNTPMNIVLTGTNTYEDGTWNFVWP